MTELLPLALTFDAFTSIETWSDILVVAGIYTIFALGLQVNVGFTGIVNFGQAGFMALGAYSMSILIVKAGWDWWLALPASILITVLFGLLIGLPSLRLRADYFAIATIAAAEIVRFSAQNARELTGGNQGQFGFDDSWVSTSFEIEEFLMSLGWSDPPGTFPLLMVVWGTAIVLTLALRFTQNTPWGRVLRAVREDEDAARALGKNPFAYKLQSLAISATLGAIAGWFLALNLGQVHPQSFEPLFTFIGYSVLVLGGLANYYGVAVGAIIMLTLYEGTRYIDPPGGADQESAVRFMIIGIVLILLMAFRPQGMFGKKQEMVLGE